MVGREHPPPPMEPVRSRRFDFRISCSSRLTFCSRAAFFFLFAEEFFKVGHPALGIGHLFEGFSIQPREFCRSGFGFALGLAHFILPRKYMPQHRPGQHSDTRTDAWVGRARHIEALSAADHPLSCCLGFLNHFEPVLQRRVRVQSVANICVCGHLLLVCPCAMLWARQLHLITHDKSMLCDRPRCVEYCGAHSQHNNKNSNKHTTCFCRHRPPPPLDMSRLRAERSVASGRVAVE